MKTIPDIMTLTPERVEELKEIVIADGSSEEVGSYYDQVSKDLLHIIEAYKQFIMNE